MDLFASVLVLWRFWEDASDEAGMKTNLDREERANVGIAATVRSMRRSSLTSIVMENCHRQARILREALSSCMA